MITKETLIKSIHAPLIHAPKRGHLLSLSVEVFFGCIYNNPYKRVTTVTKQFVFR